MPLRRPISAKIPISYRRPRVLTVERAYFGKPCLFKELLKVAVILGRIGNNYLFSGEWWMILFPSLALAWLALAVNLLGDWLRDALNPKLR